MAGAGGFEPPNAGTKNRCLNHLATPHSPDDCAKHMPKHKRQQAYRRASDGLAFAAQGCLPLGHVDNIDLDLRYAALNPEFGAA